MSRTEYIAAAGHLVGTAQDWTTEYAWDGTRWPTLQDAIDHGFKSFGCDDFSTAALVGDEVVWKGWMDREHPDVQDRRALATSLGLRWRSER